MDNGASSYRRFREGDERGLDEIIESCCDGLMLYLTSVVGNVSVAEELAEDVFVKLGTKKPRFNGKSSFKTWLYAIGRNAAVDYIRKASRRNFVSIEESAELASDEKALEEAYIEKERDLILHRAMRELSPEYRQALWLTYFEGMSNKEAAKVMRKSLRGFESVLYRARKSLKDRLEKEGFDYEKA